MNNGNFDDGMFASKKAARILLRKYGFRDLPEVVEDISQESLVRFLQKHPQGTPLPAHDDQDARRMMYGITRNVLREWMRDRARPLEPLDGLVDPADVGGPALPDLDDAKMEILGLVLTDSAPRERFLLAYLKENPQASEEEALAYFTTRYNASAYRQCKSLIHSNAKVCSDSLRADAFRHYVAALKNARLSEADTFAFRVRRLSQSPSENASASLILCNLCSLVIINAARPKTELFKYANRSLPRVPFSLEDDFVYRSAHEIATLFAQTILDTPALDVTDPEFMYFREAITTFIPETLRSLP